MFGVLLGFLALVDKSWADNYSDAEATVPQVFLGLIGPQTGGFGVDLGEGKDGFTRNWQTFWSMMLTCMVLVLAFTSIKSKEIAISDNKLFQVGAIWIVLSTVAQVNTFFGSVGINPALASMYVFFETTQYNYPNDDISADELNHYLWAYFIGPFVGAILGGFLFWIHRQTADGNVQNIKINLSPNEEAD